MLLASRVASICPCVRAAQVVRAGQQVIGHVPGKLAADAAAGDDTNALVLSLKRCAVVDVTESQRAGVEPVQSGVCARADNRAIQLRYERRIKKARLDGPGFF